MDRFGPRRDVARCAPLESPPQPLDAHLLADGEALEAAWQAELRAMVASRRGDGQGVAAARATTEAIVTRIEATRALTLDGHKVKARAESWRRDGAPLAPAAAEDPDDDGAWTDMADLPRYVGPTARIATAAFA